ncbi:MAG: agmatine deiminase family protein [Bacteroidota bacterium]
MKYLVLLICSFFTLNTFSQTDHRMSDAEKLQLPWYNQLRNSTPSTASVTPPGSPLRTMAEWEELQGFLIAWKTYPAMLREIVKAAKVETKVILLYEAPDSPTSITSYLASGGVDTVNVQFVNTPLNSVWCRDYGPWSVYTNDVDTLLTIDWIYNRPRPDDDAVPITVAGLLNSPLYQTTTAPGDLVHTGGNFMCDGFGTGFSSNLILTDNSPAGGFNVSHTSVEIDTIMNQFMGISRYIKMNTLPYDQIHHIDMHMKLIDEETLVMGQYPQGIADGPQIEANLQYILSNYMSVYGTPYKVIRIPMPDDNGAYPNTSGDYFTYTNSSFINKTLIVPTYNIPEDSIALNIYREALPGYTITGIVSTSSIPALGALHCITKELGVNDPLLISHQPYHNTYDTINDYIINARIQHRTGVASATLYYTIDTALGYTAVPMVSLASQINHWGATIPAQPSGTRIYYYIEAQSVSGKTQVRPISAPAGYWKFDILAPTAVEENSFSIEMQPAYPNPSKGITCIPLSLSTTQYITAALYAVDGKKVTDIYTGEVQAGQKNIFVNTINISSGVYFIEITTSENKYRQKLVVR